MMELNTDFVIDIATFLLVILGTIFFTVIGLFSEHAGLINVFSNGDLLLGVWEVFVGAATLYMGIYLLGVGKVVPRLHQLLN